MLKPFSDFSRNSLALDFIFVARRGNHPHAFFETLHSEFLSLEKPVVYGKTSLAPFGDTGFDHHRVAERRRQEKSCSRLDQRNPRDGVHLQHFLLGHPRAFKQRIRASIKKFKIPREINNPQRIAITPLNMNCSLINEHICARSKSDSSTRVYT
jgi:hypothetical protein